MATQNNNPIKSFAVFGLFGTKDVEITFEDNIKILVGENGMGKTQILNLLYCVLTKDSVKLCEYNFEYIHVHFFDKKNLFIYKKDLDIFFNPKSGFVSKKIKSFFQKAIHIFKRSELDCEKYIFLLNKSAFNRYFVRNNDIYNYIDIEYSFFKEWFDFVDNLNVIYYPTYRRIENSWYNDENLDNFQINEIENSIKLKMIELEQKYNPMRFGMDDIKNRFFQIKANIENFHKEGFSEFSKDILSAVIEDADISKTENILETINEKDIDIILARVGDSLTSIQKSNIKNIIAQKKIRNPLSAYLLQKLLSIYEKQQPIDDIVKTFKNVCNKYLIDKVVFYDESSIEIGVKSTITNEIIDLSLLSSGEKQILSIFANLYLLETDKNFMILFDEPELSLSMPWQKELLPDMVASGKCDFLLAVTHSPFIFDNDLDKYAMALSEYISPTKTLK